MITIILTDLEARKLRDMLEKRGNKDADLGRVHHKVHHALLRPAVKRKYQVKDPPFNPFGWDPPDKEED